MIPAKTEPTRFPNMYIDVHKVALRASSHTKFHYNMNSNTININGAAKQITKNK